jgi:hypothetical protein
MRYSARSEIRDSGCRTEILYPPRNRPGLTTAEVVRGLRSASRRFRYKALDLP